MKPLLQAHFRDQQLSTALWTDAEADLPASPASLEQRNRLLSVLLHVSNLTAHDADVRTLAEAVLERLHGLLSCDGSLCYLQEGTQLVNVAQRGPIRDFTGKHTLVNHRFPAGQPCLALRQPLLVPDLWNEEAQTVLLREQLSRFLDGPGSVARCWLFLPMILRGRSVGIILVIHHEPGSFDAEDKVFGSAFAHQAAIEFENARLDRDARQRADEIRTMLAVQRAITRRVEPDAVLQLIADEACRLTGSGGAWVFLHEQETWRMACASGQAACLLPETEAVPPYVLAALSEMGRTRRPYRLQTGKAGSARHEGLLRHYAVADLLCVPIASENGTLGLICAAQPPEGGFQAEDLRILSLLSSSAVIGMENARLYEVERRLRGQEAERAAAAERGRLARELHDAVTQTLFSASLIAEVLPRIWEKNPRQGRERLEEVRLLTRGALAEMRTLLLELRPRALEDTALDELLKHLVTAVSARSGMTVSSEVSACGGLPFDVKLGFYRIAQEALSNITKHAQATHVQVMVRANGVSGDASVMKSVSGDASVMKSVGGDAPVMKSVGGDAPGMKSVGDAGQACTILEMEIRDDGRGFNPDAISGGHLGVGIMRERAESIGSRFEMDSETGKGTTIRILWRSNLTGSGE